MFIYLSKILALLAYPLGMACILLLGTIFVDLLKQNWSWRTGIMTLVLLILWLGGNHYVAHAAVNTLESQYQTDTVATAEAIVLLGGGTRLPIPPRTMPEVNEAGDRVLYAADLYHNGRGQRIIASGGGIAWMQGGEIVYSEAESMRDLLIRLGVPAADIILEPQSQTTYENAIYTKEILGEQGIDRVLLVTSAIHMPRAVALFQKQGIDVEPVSADFFVTFEDESSPAGSFDLGAAVYYALPQVEYLEMTSWAMREWIGLTVYRWLGRA